jgi:DNA-binding NarL/FixJ family response regulator
LKQHNIVIVSESEADYYSLKASLARAEPDRFTLTWVGTHEQPVEAMNNIRFDAVILAYSLESEYLLRLAQKAELSRPIIILLDQEDVELASKLKDSGATDYLLRGTVSDDLLHRVLDYSIALMAAGVGDVIQKPQRQPAAQSVGNAIASDGGQQTAPAQASGNRKRPDTQALPIFSDAPARPREVKNRPRSDRVGVLLTMAAIALLVLAAVFSLGYWLLLRVASLEQEERGATSAAETGLIAASVEQADVRLSQLESSTALLISQIDALRDEIGAAGAETAEPLEAIVIVSAPRKFPAQRDSDSAAPAAISAEVMPLDAPSAGTSIRSGGNWFINLGTFSNVQRARRWADELAVSAGSLEVSSITRNGQQLHRVRLVGLESSGLANELARDYEQELKLQRLWVGQEQGE